MHTHHILNGDALLQRLIPLKLPDEMLVMRECLIDGPVKAETEEAFLASRASYIASAFQATIDEYEQKTATQLKAIARLPLEEECNLWFEDDLFCQTNLWYLVHSLTMRGNRKNLFLVRPTTDSWKGFGGMSDEDLLRAFASRQQLSADQQQGFAGLWKAYVDKDESRHRQLAAALTAVIPRLPDVVEAEIERWGDEIELGRPKQMLRQLKKEHPEWEFGELFKAFSEDAGIYGFGGLQVKSMVDEM